MSLYPPLSSDSASNERCASISIQDIHTACYLPMNYPGLFSWFLIVFVSDGKQRNMLP